ncbi:MAG TPA: hypothetical protein VJR29_08880, partial [bacterium]|nr:hypothetical protein [bacterium]
MTPPSSAGAPPRRPHLPILNLQGRHVPVLEPHDVSTSTSQLQSLARLASSVHSDRAEHQRQSYVELLLLDTGNQGQRRIDQSREQETAAVYAELRQYIAQAQAGDRRSYFDAMRRYFVLSHRLLENAETRGQVPALLAEFRAFARQYLSFLNDSAEFTPEQRLQYIYMASTVINNVLGRSQSNDDSRAATEAELEPLGRLLSDFLDAALAQHRRHLLAHPTGEAYTPIVREIQMRQALIRGDAGAARQRARELHRHLLAHPPGEADPNRPETRRWDLEAARLLQSDPAFNQLIQNLDSPSGVEHAGALLNGVSLELLVTISAGIDQVNGDAETAIVDRYRPLSSILAILSLTRPASSLGELITALADAGQQSTIRSEIEAALTQSSQLRTSLEGARGEVSLDDWLDRARTSAAHVERLRTGAGANLLSALLQANEINHPVHSLAEMLHHHPQLLAELGLSPTEIDDPAHQRQAALELLHRGSMAVDLLQAYQTRHPNLSLAGIIEVLSDQQLAQNRINATVTTVLENYHARLESRPDHEIAALHGVFQVLGQTSEISEGIALDSRLRTHSQELATRMESWGYRTGRAWSHMISPASLGTLAAGMILSEAAPAALIYRAGSTGRLVSRGIPLVEAGNITWQASAMTGIGTGLAMSLIGSSLHNYERASYGLDTHFWSDFGHGALINSITFGGTMLFQRRLARGLAPSAGEGQTVGQLSRSGRLGLHFGTVLFGTGLALGTGATVRRIETGQWSLSYEEVAENAMALLAWETGSAGLRRLRRRVGLQAALEGRRPFEPIQVEVPAGVSLEGLSGTRARALRITNWFAAAPARLQNFGNRIAAGMVNPFFTVLGEYRANIVRETAQRIVERNPQLGALEEVIAHRLALEEITYPGSLDQYNEAFFERYQMEIAGDVGHPRLVFVNSNNSTPRANRLYNLNIIRALREHLETCSANDDTYLPRYLPRSAFEIVQIRVDPESRRIVGVGTHNFGEAGDGALVLNASFDPRTRTLRLPPVHGETTPQIIEMGPMFDAHRSSPLPMLWTEALGQRFLNQRSLIGRQGQGARARINQALGDLNRDAVIRLPIDAETGQILDRLLNPRSVDDLPGSGTRVLRLTGRYNGRDKTLTF